VGENFRLTCGRYNPNSLSCYYLVQRSLETSFIEMICSGSLFAYPASPYLTDVLAVISVEGVRNTVLFFHFDFDDCTRNSHYFCCPPIQFCCPYDSDTLRRDLHRLVSPGFLYAGVAECTAVD
jgi:hypothetical protein